MIVYIEISVGNVLAFTGRQVFGADGWKVLQRIAIMKTLTIHGVGNFPDIVMFPRTFGVEKVICNK